MRAALLLFALMGCGPMERSAAKDPRKCELDPNCASKPAKSNDCATQCVDDIACMDRCRQVTGEYNR